MNEIQRIFHSSDGRYRVAMMLDKSGRFVLEVHAFYDEHGFSGWEDITNGMHLFESEGAAVAAVPELLRNAAGRSNEARTT